MAPVCKTLDQVEPRTGHFVVRNTASFNGTWASIVSGNAVAEWIAGMSNAFVATDPWANFVH